MLRLLRLLRLVIVAVIPGIVTVVVFFQDSLRQEILNRYDQRWCQFVDVGDRTQTVALCNRGSEDLTRVHIAIKTLAGVIDFNSSHFNKEPKQSFLNTLLQGDKLAQDLRKVTRQFTKQSFDSYLKRPSLHNVLQTLLKSAAMDAANRTKFWDNVSNFFRNRLEECRKQWKEETDGVDVVLSPIQKSLNSSINAKDLSLDELAFSAELKANEVRFLQVKYGSGEVRTQLPKVEFQPRKHITEVEVTDLDAPFWRLALKYDLKFWGLILLVMIVFPIWAHSMVKPIKERDINRIFDFALKTKDKTTWMEAFQQHSEFIEEHFKDLCRQRKRDCSSIDRQKLESFVKFSLRREYAYSRLKLQSEAQLNEAVEVQLARLVEQLPARP